MRSEQHKRAIAAVLRELIDALLYENAFGIREHGILSHIVSEDTLIPDFALAGDEQYLRLPLGTDHGALLFRVRPQRFLLPYRLSRPPVVLVARADAGLTWTPIADPGDILRLLAAHVLPMGQATTLPNLESSVHDLRVAVEQVGLSLAAAKPLLKAFSSHPRPSLLHWEQVAALRDRPFHPSARAKSGWEAEDYQRFSPEYGRAFGLDWVAIRRDHVRYSPAATGTDIPTCILNADDRRRLAVSLAAAHLSPHEYLVLPVHPWQREHILLKLYADEFARGVCMPLSRDLGRFVATSSVRSIVPASGGTVHLKLPLALSSLGALRLLPQRYLYNGEQAQRTLELIIAREPRLARQLYLCGEDCWWIFSAPGEDQFADKPGHLACLLRRYPAHLLNDPDTTLIPMSVLAVVTPDGHSPAVAHILRERRECDASAVQVLELFREVCERLTQVAFLCFRYGVMPEIHGQNVLLVLRAGHIDGLLLRDHDTLRIYLPWMVQAELPNPGYIIKLSTPNTLICDTPEALLSYFQTLGVQVNLYAIADTLSQVYALSESALWQTIQSTIANGLSTLDLPSPVREVLYHQLLESETWPTKLILTPLLQRVGTGGGSMPSGQGETCNPLRCLSVPHAHPEGNA